MGHEFFPVRIRKIIQRTEDEVWFDGVKDRREKPTPTFSDGDFAPDLVNKLKAHLRRVEKAQVAAVQEYKETVRTEARRGGRLNNHIQNQIEAARRAQGVK